MSVRANRLWLLLRQLSLLWIAWHQVCHLLQKLVLSLPTLLRLARLVQTVLLLLGLQGKPRIIILIWFYLLRVLGWKPSSSTKWNLKRSLNGMLLKRNCLKCLKQPQPTGETNLVLLLSTSSWIAKSHALPLLSQGWIRQNFSPRSFASVEPIEWDNPPTLL